MFAAWAMATTIEPFVHLMKHELYEGGDEWDRDQIKIELKRRAQQMHGGGVAASSSSDAPEHRRKYRIALGYFGKAESTCIDELRKIMTDANFWEPLPNACKTTKHRTRIAIMLGRAIALTHRVQDQNANYPNKMIAIASDPNLVDEVM